MPNDKDQNPGSDRESGEEYSFLQETIKPKPISREKLSKELIRIAISGIILGVFACLAFFALKPWAERFFQGEPETVRIPEDDTLTEDQQQEETQTQTEQELDTQDYEALFESMYDLAQQAGKSIVTVSRLSDSGEWTEETVEKNAVTGIITADNGQELLVLADNSVCGDADTWNVTFVDQTTCTASLKKQDRNLGLAVFRIPRSRISSGTWASVQVAELGNSNRVREGEPVIALGNVFGYSGSIGYGIVSTAEYRETYYDGECSVIGTNISGVSGATGALFNLDGEVIGIVSGNLWKDRETATVNAWGISDLKAVIELLANGESVPHVGISGTAVPADVQEEQGIPAGVYVMDVETDSPAMSAGIQIGDVISEVNGIEVASMTAYKRALMDTDTGTQILIRAQRIGSDGYVDVKFTVTVGSRD